MRALAQHRFGKVEALAHGGLHRAAMRLVKGMNFRHGVSSLAQSAYSAAIASISSNHLPSTVSAIITVDAGSFPPSILRRMARLATTWLRSVRNVLILTRCSTPRPAAAS